jgi:leucyl-tRNA synthetase
MEYVNGLIAARERPIGGAQWRAAMRDLTLMLAPIAPFVAEEIWRETLGEVDSVHRAAWPAYDEALATDVETTIIMQVNGKLRDRMRVATGIDDDALRALALANAKVQSAVGGQAIREVIVVPGRLVNVVTG